jgi:hypothetical protein
LYVHWEEQLKHDVALKLGGVKMEKDDTPLGDYDCQGHVIEVSLAKTKSRTSYFFKLPGVKGITSSRVDHRETVGQFLGKLTYAGGDKDTLAIGGGGEPVNVMTVRLLCRGVELQYKEKISALDCGRDESSPLEVVFVRHVYTFVHDDKLLQEHIP